jgi:hypothetical protein
LVIVWRRAGRSGRGTPWGSWDQTGEPFDCRQLERQIQTPEVRLDVLLGRRHQIEQAAL